MKKIEQKERFVRLRARGMPYSAIEKELGVSKKTLIAWGRELHEDILKERAAEIEQLRAVYWKETRGRIDLLRERQKRLHEEERTRDLSGIETPKLMALEFQTSEQLNKEIQSLSVRLSHDLLSDSTPSPESVDGATTTPVGLGEGRSASGLLATLAQGDIRDVARAILAEQTVLKEALFEIADDAASESVRVAAIKTIDSISGRMFALIQSTGAIATLSDERLIDEALAGWAARDSRELMYECDKRTPRLRTWPKRLSGRFNLATAKLKSGCFPSWANEFINGQKRGCVMLF